MLYVENKEKMTKTNTYGEKQNFPLLIPTNHKSHRSTFKTKKAQSCLSNALNTV